MLQLFIAPRTFCDPMPRITHSPSDSKAARDVRSKPLQDTYCILPQRHHCPLICSSFDSPAGGHLHKRVTCASSDYTLLAKVASGVTATLYLALCKSLQRKVAVKVLDLEAIEEAGGLVSLGFRMSLG